MVDQAQIQLQRPVVLIGLGGTGKQALQYLRRLFLDRYGVKSLPHIAMLVIDTDGREQNLDGSSYDEFDREVAFDRKLGELLVTPVGEILGNVRNNRPLYPHIDSWMDRSLDSRGDIHDGAGQIRSFGRLAFFRHYQDIQKAIHRAYETVTSSTARDLAQRYNIEVDNSEPVETWLIFSVAGGTGAGMFLDAAFLAKQEARSFGGSSARSLILLPTGFSNDLPQTISDETRYRPFANAYAALMELEAYNYPQRVDGEKQVPHRFEVQWTREQYDQRPRATIDGPVFANSWLVDSAPRDGGGQVSGNRMALCQMMAEWLFVQYSSVAPALSGEIRSAKVNQGNDTVPLAVITLSASGPQDGNGRPDDSAEKQQLLFTRLYSGFGLSKIYIPTTNLANQAYARLVGDLATEWQSGEKLSDVRSSVQKRLYPAIHLPTNGATRGFTEALAQRLSVDGTKQPLKRRFEILLDDKFQKLKARNFEPGAEQEARDWFASEIMSKMLDGGSAAKARRGEISRIVQIDNVTKAFEEIRGALNDFLNETLRTPGERVDFSEEALRLIVKDYQQAAQEANTKAKNERQKGDRSQRDADDLLKWAIDHRGFDRATLFEGAFAKMRERATAEFRKQVYEAISETATIAADHVGIGRKVKDSDGRERSVETGLLSALFALRQTLKTLAARSQERIAALQRQPASPLNSKAPAKKMEGTVTPEVELDEIYKTSDGGQINGDVMASHEEELYKYLGHKGFVSPWYLRDFADGGEVESIFLDMLDFSRTQLSYLPGKMQDALDCLSKKYSNDNKSKFEDEVRKVIDRGSPWLPKPIHNMAGNTQYNNLSPAYYVAVSPASALEPRKTTLRAAGVSVDNAGQPTGGQRKVVDGPLDTVYFESEVPGVPLCAVRNIDLYRNAYLGYLGSKDPGTSVVHIELDIEKYTDLVPLTWQEYSIRQEALVSFIQGVAKGVIVPRTDVDQQAKIPQWQFSENTTISVHPRAWQLGRYTTAVRLLARPDRELCSALQREIAAFDLNALTEDDTARLYNIYDGMARQQPVGGSEWARAIATVLSDMRSKYGNAIVEQARNAQASSSTWLDSVPSGSSYPFLRLGTLVRTS